MPRASRAFGACGVNPDAIERELDNRGLQPIAQRPGDLVTKAGYWRNLGWLGDLTDLVEFGVGERLKETSEGRPGHLFSNVEAWNAVERLAPALTLGGSMEFVLPDVAPDQIGLDPFKVLEDWPRTHVNVLLQRGLLVPAGFGRLRFYHRSAQEYPSAC